jgi:DNA invertase Pin-like site-specific DNA recombinase
MLGISDSCIAQASLTAKNTAPVTLVTPFDQINPSEAYQQGVIDLANAKAELFAIQLAMVRWVDRLGRNYEDVVETIQTFMKRGIVIRTVINNFTFDGATTDPMLKAVRDALIGFMAATAQAQAEATKAAVKAGISHAHEMDDLAYIGRRPSFTRDQFKQVESMVAAGVTNTTQIADAVGLQRMTVARIRANPAKAADALGIWETKDEMKKAGKRGRRVDWQH